MRPAAVLLALAVVLHAQESRPRFNTSYVPAHDEEVRALVLTAERLASEGDPAGAADRLQALMLSESDSVVAIQDDELYVSPRRWAQIQLLSERPPFTRAVLDAWRAAQDDAAGRALAGAIATGDEEAILGLLDRYPAATAAPAAVLALFDRAVQRADADRARGLLLRLPEHLPRSEEEAYLAAPAYRDRRDHLDRLADPPPAGWPTIGGAPDRARNGDPIGEPAGLVKLWETPFLETEPHEYLAAESERSPTLPFCAVCDEEHLYVHLGPTVAVLDRESGKLLFYASGTPPDANQTALMRLQTPGVRAATVDEGVLYFDRVLFDAAGEPLSRNELVAYDVVGRRVLWSLRPPESPAALDRDLFFRGAPAVCGRRLFVYGAVRDVTDSGPARKEEAHLFCLDKRSGRLLWHRFLGYGDTEAPPHLPPLSGLAPAVAHGVVTGATGVGVAAALDERTGEVLWLFRHDRRPLRARERLSEYRERKVHLQSGWFREPPRVVDGRVFFAPFDAEDLYCGWLRGRRSPRDGAFHLVQWPKGRTKHFYNSLLEYVAGVHGGRIYYAGRRDEHHAPENYQTVVSNSFESELDLRYGRIPPTKDGGGRVGVPPELYGRPVIAGDVLLVPTREAVYRFDVGRAPRAAEQQGERFREIPYLPPFEPPPADVPEGAETPPAFGNLVAVDGFLYAVNADRVVCYGRK